MMNKYLALNKNSDQLFNTVQIILICLAFFAAVILLNFAKKLFYRIFLKKRYYVFPKLSTRGIANVAMVISISISIILLLAFLTAGVLAVLFRVYPGSRINIEGILIKIGGLFFGPVIGIFIGAVTDLLTVALSAGAFHYGYFIVAMVYGFIGGIIRALWDWTKKRQFSFSCIISLLWAIVLTIAIVYMEFLPIETFRITLFGHLFILKKIIVVSIILSVFVIGFLCLWVCFLTSNKKNVKLWKMEKTYSKMLLSIRVKSKTLSDRQVFANWQMQYISKHMLELNKKLLEINEFKNNLEKQKNKTNFFQYFAPVLGMVLSCECLVNIIVLPNIDINFSAYNFEYWIMIRTLEFIIMVLFNLLVIYPIYRILASNIKYNYKTDLIEDIKVPLIIN